MAVVPVVKLRLVGLKGDYENIMELLTDSGCFELNERQFAIASDDHSVELGELDVKRARTGFAISYLIKESDRYVALKTKPALDFEFTPPKTSSVRSVIGSERLFGIKNKEASLSSGVIDEINRISYRQNEISHEKQRLKENIDAYRVFSAFPLKFCDVKDTACTFSRLFAGGAGIKLPPLVETVLTTEYGASIVCVTGLASESERVLSAMGEAGFVPCPYSGEITATEAIDAETARIDALTSESNDLLVRTLSLSHAFDDLKILFDYYAMLSERYSKRAGASTDYITAIEGWCPESEAERLYTALTERFGSIYIDTAKPDDNDIAPTLLKNNKLVEPFEDLTAMYTTPAYTDKDPNFFMSIWFFLFFGMMVGDVVYGMLLVAGSILFLRFVKVEKGFANLVKLIGTCGVSSIIWGTLFGSFMGFGIKTDIAFSYTLQENGASVRYFGWFNPMEEPIKLLVLSIVSGMAHLAFAFGIKGALLIKDKKPISAFCDAGFNLMTVAGITLLGLNIFAHVFATGQLDLSAQFFSPETSAALNNAGMVLLLVSIAGIFLMAGRESLRKANVLNWFGAGINGLYGGLIGLVADILSYSRLFGLGLAGGAIAFAFNTLVQQLFFGGGILAMIIGAVLLFALHLFNLGISLLGTYVHNARLQFLEYYGKFLTGDGRPFTPLGSGSKYTVLRSNNAQNITEE